MPTPEEIRSVMAGLTPEQQLQFMDELEKRQKASPSVQPVSPPARPDPPGPGSSFSDVMAWKERAFEPGGQVIPQTPEEQAGAAQGAGTGLSIAGSTALLGAAGALGPRVVGATEGYRLGKKPAQAVGLPGAAGGVPGAVIGALNPGATITAGVGEMAGNAVGGEGAGIPMALAALWARKKGLGPIIDLLTKMRGAKGAATAGTMADEVAAARRAAEVAKAIPLSEEKAAILAAARARRAQQAAESVKAARGTVEPPVAPELKGGWNEMLNPLRSTKGPTPESLSQLSPAEREAAMEAYKISAARAAEKEAAAKAGLPFPKTKDWTVDEQEALMQRFGAGQGSAPGSAGYGKGVYPFDPTVSPPGAAPAPDYSAFVAEARKLMGSVRGRDTIKEWLSHQTPEVAAKVQQLLFGG